MPLGQERTEVVFGQGQFEDSKFMESVLLSDNKSWLGSFAAEAPLPTSFSSREKTVKLENIQPEVISSSSNLQFQPMPILNITESKQTLNEGDMMDFAHFDLKDDSVFESSTQNPISAMSGFLPPGHALFHDCPNYTCNSNYNQNSRAPASCYIPPHESSRQENDRPNSNNPEGQFPDCFGHNQLHYLGTCNSAFQQHDHICKSEFYNEYNGNLDYNHPETSFAHAEPIKSETQKVSPEDQRKAVSENFLNLVSKCSKSEVVGKNGFDMNLIKDEDEVYTCHHEHCGRKFKFIWALNEHLKRAHQEEKVRKHKCKICNKGFFTKSCLKSHMKIHTREPNSFKCNFAGCKKTYSTSEGLRLHIRNHHQVDKKWVCPVDGCSKKFVRQSDLRLHILRIHAETRPHPCSFKGCTKSFACYSELRRHEQSHIRKMKKAEELERKRQRQTAKKG